MDENVIDFETIGVYRRFNKLLPILMEMPLDGLGLILGEAVSEYFSGVSATALYAFIHKRVVGLHHNA